MKSRRTVLSILLLASLAGCGGGGTPPPGGLTIGVVVTPPTPRMQVGTTLQLKAVVTGPPGVPQGVSWRTLSPDLATVNGNGLVSALTEGEAIIRVAWLEDQLEFTDVAIVITTLPVGEVRGALPPPGR
jgi:hypothetical protein